MKISLDFSGPGEDITVRYDILIPGLNPYPSAIGRLTLFLEAPALTSILLGGVTVQCCLPLTAVIFNFMKYLNVVLLPYVAYSVSFLR